MADDGWSAVERVTNANGRCPFRASGTPTTQHSAMVGWEEIACSIDPILYQNRIGKGNGGELTSAKSVSRNVNNII